MDPNQTITSEQAREMFMTYFNTENFLTPEQRRQIDTMFAARGCVVVRSANQSKMFTPISSRGQRLAT
jgi:Spy/CpxP family protein refolding chaperone